MWHMHDAWTKGNFYQKIKLSICPSTSRRKTWTSHPINNLTPGPVLDLDTPLFLGLGGQILKSFEVLNYNCNCSWVSHSLVVGQLLRLLSNWAINLEKNFRCLLAVSEQNGSNNSSVGCTCPSTFGNDIFPEFMPEGTVHATLCVLRVKFNSKCTDRLLINPTSYQW